MYGANPSSPSKCCLARASGVWSNLKPARYHILDCPPSNRQSHECVNQLRMHHKVHWKVFMLQEGSCVYSSMQMLWTRLWALQSSCYVALKLTTFLSCSMHTTTSTEHSIIIYCMLLLYTLVIIVLHIHTRVGTCSSCNDPVAIMVNPDTVWRHFWCDLQ